MSRGAAVTIGTFDGVHRGHRRIVRETCACARRLGLDPVAVTFHIPPRLFFFPSGLPALLTTVQEKVALLRAAGVRRVEVLHFDRALSSLSAESFFERILIRRLGARAIVVGYNFGFGRDREGDARFLERKAKEHGIPVRILPPLCAQSVPVSSGRIRDALRAGELEAANRLLGYPYFAVGKVRRGRRLGRKIGFPTANLEIAREKILPAGVFAVRAALAGSPKVYEGVCNVGIRPTVSGARPRPIALEAHLFRFRGELYGRLIKVEFHRRLRAERAFPGLPELEAQIERDCRAAESYFASRG